MNLVIFSQLYSELQFFLYFENSHSRDELASSCNIVKLCLLGCGQFGKGKGG